MTNQELINRLVQRFSKFEQVEGITLAGSMAFNTSDENSDLDIDVYITKEIPPEERKKIAEEFADYMEINNTFWGPGDEWKLKNSLTSVDIIYLDINWINDHMRNVIDKHEAWVGYTTCFWHNVVDSKILYDKNNILEELQDKYTTKYPVELKQNIIAKNYPILRDNMSSYYYQIDKALKREDYISINHRVAALFASYFDILFAINEIRHPGEKKLIKIINNTCRLIPENMEENITNILKNCALVNNEILNDISKLIDNLDDLLKEQKLLNPLPFKANVK